MQILSVCDSNKLPGNAEPGPEFVLLWAPVFVVPSGKLGWRLFDVTYSSVTKRVPTLYLGHLVWDLHHLSLIEHSSPLSSLPSFTLRGVRRSRPLVVVTTTLYSICLRYT